MLKFWKGNYVKLKKNDILLPWTVVNMENERIEVQRVYHLFNFSELQEFQTENLSTILIRSLGNEKTGNNYFLLLKKKS